MSIITFALLLPLPSVSLGQQAKPYHPAIMALGHLLEGIKSSNSRRAIHRGDLDSLVSYFQVVERLGDLDTPTSYDRGMPDSTYVWTYSVLGKLAQYSRADTSIIRTILKLASIIKRSAELAESMPEYVQQTLQANTKGFLQIYLTLSKADQQEAIEFLDWPSDIDARSILKGFAARTTIGRYKQAATTIATQLNPVK